MINEQHNDKGEEFAAMATVIAFLNGEGPLDGFHFGDSDTDRPRLAYWWRKPMMAAWRALASRPAAHVSAPTEAVGALCKAFLVYMTSPTLRNFDTLLDAVAAVCNSPAPAQPAAPAVAAVDAPYGYTVEHPSGMIIFFKEDPDSWREEVFAKQGIVVRTLLAAPDCGACPGDGSICSKTCKVADESPVAAVDAPSNPQRTPTSAPEATGRGDDKASAEKAGGLFPRCDMEAFAEWKGYPLPPLNNEWRFDEDWLHREFVAFCAGRRRPKGGA